MSDEKKSLLGYVSENGQTVSEDFTPNELALIEQFKNDGLPGVASVDDKLLTRMMEMFLAGKPYPMIASACRCKKALVLFYSQKFGWPKARKDYLAEVELTIYNRLNENKIESQDFLLNLVQTWQEQINKKVKKYTYTGDEKFINEIDLKVLDKYLKTLEILHKTGMTSSGDLRPSVGLNLGSGVTVKKLNNNEVEITPKEKKLGDMLKILADERREEELRKSGKMPDSKEKKED